MADVRFGAVVTADGVHFTTWAPAQRTVAVVIEGGGEHPMSRDDRGMFTARVRDAGAGRRYWYRLQQGLRPDPASRFQPDGPLGPSQIVDLTSHQWMHDGWRGAPEPHRHVIYEMHIGTFTTEGTWRAAAARLPSLVEVGVTTLEVMPIAEYAGRFGWGYDGVQLFAPSHLYGTPDDAMHFIDTAHGLGLAVILDVVYNHFGPVGNFISEFAPTFLGAAGEWGDLINYDREGSDLVRQFMIANVEQWIGSYRFDGLRFDATQAIHDSSPEHIVSTLCATARRAAGTRRVFLVGESEPQDMRLLKISGAYADGLDAIWSEDWHHSAFVALTGRRDAYFTDYRGDAPEFASMARHGTLYQGQWYTWQTAPRGGYGLGLPSSSFVDFLENHDQVANTGLGGRLWHYTSPGAWRAMTGLLLLGPAVPLLFQGQEFGSSRPFTYFADHSDSPELAEAVRAGRLQFLAQFPAMATPEMQERIPPPHDPATFDACRLLDKERTADSPLRRLHRDLLALRRDDPVVARLGTDAVRVESSAPAPRILLLRYLGPDSHRLLIVNLGDDHLSPMNDPLLAPRAGGCSWRVQWSSDEAAYGGPGRIAFVGAGRWLFRAGSAVLLTDAH